MGKRQGHIGPAGSARTQEQLRSMEKLLVSQREADLREVLDLPAGRRLILDIIDRRCGAHGTGYSASGSEMYFLCGQRAVGIDLREDVKHLDEDLYLLMMREGLSFGKEMKLQREDAETKSTTYVDDDEDEADL